MAIMLQPIANPIYTLDLVLFCVITVCIYLTVITQFMSKMFCSVGVKHQVVGTFLLLLGIFAICDSENAEAKRGIQPLMVGLVLWAIGASFGFNCGYAINPARDLGPRIFTAMAGWGKEVFV